MLLCRMSCTCMPHGCQCKLPQAGKTSKERTSTKVHICNYHVSPAKQYTLYTGASMGDRKALPNFTTGPFSGLHACLLTVLVVVDEHTVKPLPSQLMQHVTHLYRIGINFTLKYTRQEAEDLDRHAASSRCQLIASQCTEHIFELGCSQQSRPCPGAAYRADNTLH